MLAFITMTTNSFGGYYALSERRELYYLTVKSPIIAKR